MDNNKKCELCGINDALPVLRKENNEHRIDFRLRTADGPIELCLECLRWHMNHPIIEPVGLR